VFYDIIIYLMYQFFIKDIKKLFINYVCQQNQIFSYEVNVHSKNICNKIYKIKKYLIEHKENSKGV
jgi:hypothetical protein